MEILTVNDHEKSYHEEFPQHLFKERAAVKSHPHTQQLADIIADYMKPLGITKQQDNHLTALKEGAPVIIGGQQAGLFISPLYTIHKIISIIVLAREQSHQLNRPVIPVFWIAGEDHDFSEVNHAYLYDDSQVRLNKVKVATKQQVETSVSDFMLSDEEKHSTVHEFMSKLKETERTRQIQQLLSELPNAWTDQVKQLIHELFKESGLLLIDSNDPAFRRLEKETFKYMLTHHEAIHAAFIAGQKKSVAGGQQQMIETNSNVHLFMKYDNQRQLLNFTAGKFVLNKSDVTFTRDELLRLIDTEPELFSNNVVTRPVMQELMFNTLCFIGGPSEIKYWNELADVFAYLDRPLPILIPRMRITYINRRIQKLLEQYELNISAILTDGMQHQQEQFLADEANKALLVKVDALEQQLTTVFSEITELAETKQVQVIAGSNLEHHLKQLDYFRKAYQRELRQKNEIVLRHFKEIELHLNPRGGLQERTWHPLQLINDTDLCIFTKISDELVYTTGQVVIEL
ncbi:bacillithiol biosynthesis cysteine-adding enzyme BshC [Macrococcus equipercicus]|uniref:Putative cysteine ligase BshC n=1 Tax=Macrococcus equipercicus TaxID=69967 RepID=A0ABQ6RBX0_9STAP|nr:bacillithiol biosynthesis cysteine-adding enzyme BshC [Macrococcus equipercicus]KAA1042704.1 bacillithiol biosynthesis cysteine-adding enzyme BshC [Macrococcus equipercicus]